MTAAPARIQEAAFTRESLAFPREESVSWRVGMNQRTVTAMSIDIDNVALARKAYGVLEEKRDSERETADFQPYIDLLAQDVVFRYAAPEGTPLSGELRGKDAVVKFMTVTAPKLADDVRLTRPLEFVGSGDRVVVLGAETYTITKSGVTVENKEFAVVMDFRDGLISRVVQLKDLSEFVKAYRTAGAR